MEILIGASIGIDRYPDGKHYLRIITDKHYQFYFALITPEGAQAISEKEELEITDVEYPEESSNPVEDYINL